MRRNDGDARQIGRIGVAGCGAMGLPMARRMLAAGYDVSGFDVRPLDDFGDFAAHMIVDPREFSRHCDTVFSVVRDAAQTRELCFEAQALFASEPHPERLVLCSTLSPRFVAEVREQLPADVALMDGAMSGAPYRAAAGTLSFMLGGPEAEIERLVPLFEAMGKHLYRLGELGRGMTAKVLNNYVAACSVAASRRVFAGAQALGLEPAVLRQVMASSSGGNWYADNFDRIDWALEDYSPDNTMGIIEKDVRCALDALRALPLPDSPLDEAVIAALRRLPPAV